MRSDQLPEACQQVLNPEELASVIRSANLEPCQLSAEPSMSRIARVAGPKTCLDLVCLGPAMLFTGVMPSDCYTLVFIIECPKKGRSFNFKVDHHDEYMAFFSPGGQVDAYTPEGYSNASLTVPVEEFHRVMERSFPEMPASILKTGCGVRVGVREKARMRRLIAALDEAIEDSDRPLSGLMARREVERQLLDAFLALMRSGFRDLVPEPNMREAGRLRRLRLARDFVEAHAHRAFQLRELCDGIGMSERGVEVMFQDLLEVSPHAFIRNQRLHGVRRSLLASEPEPGVVKRTALEWGFWHMGHFGGSYRSLFGESPGATALR